MLSRPVLRRLDRWPCCRPPKPRSFTRLRILCSLGARLLLISIMTVSRTLCLRRKLHGRGRVARDVAGWEWLIAEGEDRCLGYAYGGLHRERSAYRWSAEVSAYVHSSYH